LPVAGLVKGILYLSVVVGLGEEMRALKEVK
jgi:hypothetical protein